MCTKSLHPLQDMYSLELDILYTKKKNTKQKKERSQYEAKRYRNLSGSPSKWTFAVTNWSIESTSVVYVKNGRGKHSFYVTDLRTAQTQRVNNSQVKKVRCTLPSPPPSLEKVLVVWRCQLCIGWVKGIANKLFLNREKDQIWKKTIWGTWAKFNSCGQFVRTG